MKTEDSSRSRSIAPAKPAEEKPKASSPKAESRPKVADGFTPTPSKPTTAKSSTTAKRTTDAAPASGPAQPSPTQPVDPNGRASDARNGAEAAARLKNEGNYPTGEWERIRGSDFTQTVKQHQDDPQFLADMYKALGPTDSAKMIENAGRAAESKADLDAVAHSLNTAFSSGKFSAGEQRMFGEQAAANPETALAVGQVLGSAASAPGGNEMRRGFLDAVMTPGKALGTGQDAGLWARAAGEAMAGDPSGKMMQEYVGRMTEAERTSFFENGINQGSSWGPASSAMPFGGLEEVMRQASAQGLLPARIEQLRVPNDAELIDRLNGVRSEPLTPEQEGLIRNLSDPRERRMFLATVKQLEAAKAGSVTPSQYMTNLMQSAADIAGNDGKEFAHLVHFGFNEPAGGSYMTAGRGLLGGGNIPAGSLLEDTFKSLDNDVNNTAGGFNANIIDVDPSSTVTHHFAEFLSIGSSLQGFPALANQAVTTIDNPKDNPGDVRSGYFGVMVGNALKDGKITPQQAVDLTKWAYTDQPAGMGPPPWGTANTGTYLDPANYSIDDWLKAYQAAQ
ncbi:MAG TPA: hypothetical protein VIG99_11075 [Myxococcaceae bacterium]|jgi:hypothetical protein